MDVLLMINPANGGLFLFRHGVLKVSAANAGQQCWKMGLDADWQRAFGEQYRAVRSNPASGSFGSAGTGLRSAQRR
jgi:hypothetical protein